MYMVKMKIGWLQRSLIITVIVMVVTISVMVIFSPEINAQIVESSKERAIREAREIQHKRIYPPVSQSVSVSVTVLENLSLSIINGQPKFATNWPFGATLIKYIVSENEIYWTVTADY